MSSIARFVSMMSIRISNRREDGTRNDPASSLLSFASACAGKQISAYADLAISHSDLSKTRLENFTIARLDAIRNDGMSSLAKILVTSQPASGPPRDEETSG
jgi:hypothetical protein